MSETYLDTNRSVIISSPAGSGKTEKLARRYIALLADGTPLERILCITFTEKAAAEMKGRILDIMRRETPEELARLMPRVPLMRISTIHSFCLKLLRRFSFELGLDPAADIIDELTASALWQESVYEHFRAERERGTALSGLITERGLKGWGRVVRVLDGLHRQRLFVEMLREAPATPFVEAYLACLDIYNRKKSLRHQVDFNDLELMAYRALLQNPEWANVLYSFDEHTDHILVDEFQDTSSLQWLILEKLTEEWRAGMGAKRELGRTPTVFLVGDVKQSIYMFRGGNPSVFKRARALFDEWLGEEYEYFEARENYRSLPQIIDFTNTLFSCLMPPDQPEQWRTTYSPFEPTRTGRGSVELVLMRAEDSRKHELRTREASLMARMIRSKLEAKRPVIEDETPRPVAYKDIAILLRGRTHLGLIEDELRSHGIPYVVLKGIGFFDEPETAMLREFVSFIADPSDDYALFCLLRSPLLGMHAKRLEGLLMHAPEGVSLLERMRGSALKDIMHAVAVIDSLLLDAPSVPLGLLIESLMLRTRGWEAFAEPERRANIKKFITLVEGYEAGGSSALEVREALIRLRGRREIPRANINTEDMDAVRIMTVHAAKGLQFPYVFFPSLDDSGPGRSGPVAVDDEYGPVELAIEEDSAKRRGHPLFDLLRAKAEEEEKRLLYVAVTRAMDSLTLIGAAGADSKGNPKYPGALGWIHAAFDLAHPGLTPYPFELLTEAEIPEIAKEGPLKRARRRPLKDIPVHTDPIEYEPPKKWRDVTEEDVNFIRRRHGEHGVAVGRVVHVLFDELSGGIIDKAGIPARAARLLAEENAAAMDRLGMVIEDITRMDRDGLLDEIVMPQPGAHSELPFVLEKGKFIYSGRIDRLVIKDGTAHVYDYKTFPAGDPEIPAIREQYRPQLTLYKEAAAKLFGLPSRAYLVLTHRPLVVEL